MSDITRKARIDLAAITDVSISDYNSAEYKAYKSMQWLKTYAKPLLEEVTALRAALKAVQS